VRVVHWLRSDLRLDDNRALAEACRCARELDSTKDLLVDWRLGERFFYRRLVDGDPASNNGGWQWAASTGTDAQPWFRIVNPVAQGRRYDPEGAYVRRWVPELRGVEDDFVHAPWRAESPPRDDPAPIVDHAARRSEVLRRYEAAKGRGAG
jgi:deoxyribodipyrimidine photo-lyase